MQNTAAVAMPHWKTLCKRDDLVANSGVVARVNNRQVALFYLPDSEGQTVFAIDNRDPKSGANVIGRGLTAHINGELVVASPLYKQHFCLLTGRCLEYPDQQLPVWQSRINGEHVEICLAD